MSPGSPLVSLILVTMRPHLLVDIRAMLDQQTCTNTEIIIALHGHAIRSLTAAQQAALAGARVVMELPGDWSLGRCLNAAVSEARGDFIAKIDDDDLYGPHYLEETVAHLLRGDGAVVGKAEIYVYLEGSGVVLLWRPGLSHKRLKFIAGATLACARSLALRTPFRDVSLGEDSCFLEDCRSAGQIIYATSRRHYMCVRRRDVETHTSILTDGKFFESGIVIRRDANPAREELLRAISVRR